MIIRRPQIRSKRSRQARSQWDAGWVGGNLAFKPLNVVLVFLCKVNIKQLLA
jgi:hypothetical protein